MKIYLKIKGALNPTIRTLINFDREMVIHIDNKPKEIKSDKN